ncbi:MAG: hypothetical protein AAGD09_03235 [Cyanobacteria bacterium P01_F01_bin.56]
MSRATRIEELKKLYYGESGTESNWRSIQQIAQPLGISKPDEGWDEAIPLIAAKELAARTAKVASEKPASARVAIQDTPWRKPRTDLNGNLIPNPFKS